MGRAMLCSLDLPLPSRESLRRSISSRRALLLLVCMAEALLPSFLPSFLPPISHFPSFLLDLCSVIGAADFPRGGVENVHSGSGKC